MRNGLLYKVIKIIIRLSNVFTVQILTVESVDDEKQKKKMNQIVATKERIAHQSQFDMLHCSSKNHHIHQIRDAVIL